MYCTRIVQVKDPHESMVRLLACAATATKGSTRPVRAWADLAVWLDVSPQTMTNWKNRGVSTEGALAAERAFGCLAVWVLEGLAPTIPPAAPGTAAEPAPPNYNAPPQTRALTESEWHLLEDIEALPKEDQKEVLEDIRRRADKFRTYAQQVLDRLRQRKHP